MCVCWEETGLPAQKFVNGFGYISQHDGGDGREGGEGGQDGRGPI